MDSVIPLLCIFLWLRSTALLFPLIVLDVAEAATAADARVAKLDEGLATGGLLNDAANKGVDDNEVVVETECMEVEEPICGTSLKGPFSKALRS